MRRRGPARLVLSERDQTVLAAVGEHRLLSSGQIERLLFEGHHVSALATRRRCQAVLRRLVDAELLDRLQRRVGGQARGGSTSFVYFLTTRGRRAVGLAGRGGRFEPSERFAAHTLACAEVSVGLQQALRRGELRSLVVTHEPDTWRRFMGRHGQPEVLRPDLLVELTTPEGWQLRWWVECDLASEAPSTVRRMCQRYQRYWRSGTEAHPVFPRVLWSVPDAKRAEAIERVITSTAELAPELFQVATAAETAEALLSGDRINET